MGCIFHTLERDLLEGAVTVTVPDRQVVLVTGMLAIAVALASACQGDAVFEPPHRASDQQHLYVPPTLSLYEVTLDGAEGARQLEHIVQDRVRLSQVVIGFGVAANAQGGPGVTTYVVKEGDSLTGIAAAHGLTLAALESANGPTPPALLVAPSCPDTTTSFVEAQCRHLTAMDAQQNAERLRAWSTAADALLLPAQADLVRQLHAAGSRFTTSADPNSGERIQAFADSIQVGATNLGQLPQPRVLLLAAVGERVQPNLRTGELSGIDLVVTGLSSPAAQTWWNAAGRKAGARSIHVLDPTLSELTLARTVNATT